MLDQILLLTRTLTNILTFNCAKGGYLVGLIVKDMPSKATLGIFDGMIAGYHNITSSTVHTSFRVENSLRERPKTNK